MRGQSGNFLIQALLALTLMFVFIPFLTERLSIRNVNSQMYSATQQIDVAQTAACVFVRENADKLPYNTTVISGKNFTDTLEPYGLPLGFIPRTAMGQDISLVINKNQDEVSGYLKLSGGNLSQLQLAELARRVGFYATQLNGDLIVGLALNDVYSDVVRRNETNLDTSIFLTNLDMGGNKLDNVGEITGRRGDFDTGQFNDLTIFGAESGYKMKNDIKNIRTNKAVFQTNIGDSALSLTHGELSVGTLDARTISKFGTTGNFTSNSASVYNFSLTAGRTDFTGPAQWNVKGNVITDKVNFDINRLEIGSFINTARGQNVYINPSDLEYNSISGIETKSIVASNITMRDQTSASLVSGGTGAVILDIRPGGTSVLPDVLLNDVDNDSVSILAAGDNAGLTSCSSIISGLKGEYNRQSLSQSIICQYLFWKRLEERINAK